MAKPWSSQRRCHHGFARKAHGRTMIISTPLPLWTKPWFIHFLQFFSLGFGDLDLVFKIWCCCLHVLWFGFWFQMYLDSVNQWVWWILVWDFLRFCCLCCCDLCCWRGPLCPWGPTRRVWGWKKNPFSKRARFGFSGQTRRLGSGIRKLVPNPTRCHSY